MNKFLIGEGHDGPARIGEFQAGKNRVELPALLTSRNSEIQGFHHVRYSEENVKSVDSGILSLPFHKEIDVESLEEHEHMILLPSVPYSSDSISGMAQSLLERQKALAMDWSRKIDPGRLILRIPPDASTAGLLAVVEDLHEEGIRSAAFLFNGNLGPRDFNALRFRAEMPSCWFTIGLGKIQPWLVPLLYYFGIDVFDIGYAHQAALEKTRLWEMAAEEIEEHIPLRFCPCDGCSGITGFNNMSDSQLEDMLLRHNLNTYRKTMSKAVDALHREKLRWLVESFTHSSPAYAATLRRANKKLYNYLEEFTPTAGDATLNLIGSESYYAPTVQRFREFIISRYFPPDGKQLALLLPCSARKPYSESRSHRRFQRAIQAGLGRNRGALSEIILTSPLGVIPRELERAYPVAEYDIPVTGDWDQEELDIAADALTAILEKYDDSVVVVAHVSGGYADAVKAAESKISQSIIYSISDDHPTRRDSLNALSETLHDMLEVLNIEFREQTEFRDTLRATADYQFGAGAGELLVPDNADFRGRLYRTVVCEVEGEQVCTFVGSNGSLSLTNAGGRRLSELDAYWVRIGFDGSKLQGSSLFAVGIEEADDAIRPGDEVIVLDPDQRVIAVGKSEMSGREMCEFENGLAVHLRHKRS